MLDLWRTVVVQHDSNHVEAAAGPLQMVLVQIGAGCPNQMALFFGRDGLFRTPEAQPATGFHFDENDLAPVLGAQGRLKADQINLRPLKAILTRQDAITLLLEIGRGQFLAARADRACIHVSFRSRIRP